MEKSSSQTSPSSIFDSLPVFTGSPVGSKRIGSDRNMKRKADPIDDLLNLKRSIIDSTGYFNTTRWNKSCQALCLLTPENSPDRSDKIISSEKAEPEPVEEPEVEPEVRFDPVTGFIENELENAIGDVLKIIKKSKFFSNSIFQEEDFDSLGKEYKYQLAIMNLYCDYGSIFTSNILLCNSILRGIIEQMEMINLNYENREIIFIFLISTKSPKAWADPDKINALQRLNGEMACKIRDVLCEIDDRGLPKWISLQMNLFPQLKELSLNMT